MTNDIQHLSTTLAPWVSRVVKDILETKGYILHWCVSHQCKIYELDGEKMKTYESCFEEIVGKFNFPDYFGNNFNALLDYISDSEILQGEAFLIWIDNGEKVLSETTDGALEGFLNILRAAGERWATPEDSGEWWDRPARAFHVIFSVPNGTSDILQLLPIFALENTGGNNGKK
jgi:RNAse (barnase) inhibitor barstar